MPQSIYWDSLNLIMTSGDGINGSIKYKGFELNYTMDAPLVANKTTEANVWAPHILNSINTSFGSHQLVSVAYDFDSIPLRIKSDWSKIDLGSDYTAPFKYYYPNMTKGSQGAEMVTSGIEYKGENFVLAAESTMVKPSYMKWSQVGEFYKGYSLTGSYEFTDNITGRINYNEYNNKSDLLKGLPDHYMYAKDINVGVNYHKDNWQVGAEVHKINGGRWLNQQEFLANPSSYKEWYMVGINIVYFFD
jgi:hypothetical protein